MQESFLARGKPSLHIRSLLALLTNDHCSFVPPYPNLSGDTFICSVPGAVAGETQVSGDSYVQVSFQYSYSNIWRNLGIVIAFWIFFLAVYMIGIALSSSSSSTGEVLLFVRGRGAKEKQKSTMHASNSDDRDCLPTADGMQKNCAAKNVGPAGSQRSIFTWRDIVYDIHIKDEPRRLLDHVSGWVKPGTLTALMGVSGAGKTTLLDVLAQRTSVGIITGDMLVDGKPLDPSFQRRTGMIHEKHERHRAVMLIVRQDMYSNRMFTLRPQPFVKRYVLARCCGSPNRSRKRRNLLMSKT